MEWQRLSEHYRSLQDEELRELAAEMPQLTETAQQVLREEMKRRGVAPIEAQPVEARPVQAQRAAVITEDMPAWGLDYQIPPTRGDSEEELDEQAQELKKELRRAGIDSWVKRQRGRYAQVVVAADQLEEARGVASQPIATDIVEEVKRDAEQGPAEFEMPVCSKCGASDPLLMGVEPANRWRCGACGNEWIEGDAESVEPAAGGR